jgi:hypothetical protein
MFRILVSHPSHSNTHLGKIGGISIGYTLEDYSLAELSDKDITPPSLLFFRATKPQMAIIG